jgi:NADH pyrophosphatase NudC (nudix superfamily)
MYKCPGQDARNLSSTIRSCPMCGASVEMFSDEQHRRCSKCRTMVFAEETPTCFQWCGGARECLGPERYEQVMKVFREAQERKQHDGACTCPDPDATV